MSIDLNLKLHLASLAELGGVGTSSASPPKKNIYIDVYMAHMQPAENFHDCNMTDTVRKPAHSTSCRRFHAKSLDPAQETSKCMCVRVCARGNNRSCSSSSSAHASSSTGLWTFEYYTIGESNGMHLGIFGIGPFVGPLVLKWVHTLGQSPGLRWTRSHLFGLCNPVIAGPVFLSWQGFSGQPHVPHTA